LTFDGATALGAALFVATMAASKEIIKRIMALFSGDMEAHGTHGEPEQKGLKWEIRSTAKTLREPVTVDLWASHLAGNQPLGVIPIRKDNTCLWGSIDVDDYSNDLLTIISKCEQEKLPLVPGRSKSGGLHLFLFINEPTPAENIQTVLRNLASMLGVAGSEIFPKQTKLSSNRNDLGSWMVMPYFGHTYKGKLREQVGLRKTGAELTLEEFIKSAEETKVSTADLMKWTARQPRARTPGTTKNQPGIPSREPFADGPVCLQILSKTGVPLGGQNNALLNMGIYYKRIDPNTWKQHLEVANREFLTPPGSAEGLISVIRSLEKKDYNYTCKTEPLVSHCNSLVCRQRKYGVGDDNALPHITGLSKLATDPPLWFVDMDDYRLEVQTDDLLYYNRFLKICFEKQKVYHLQSQGAWLQVLRPLMDNCTIIEAPIEVGKGGQFQELLEEFCTNRQRGRSREDLLVGRPWENEEEGLHYFRLKDFQKYLIKEGIREYTRGQITQQIKHFEGGFKFLKIKEHGVNTWWVPSKLFEHRDPVDIPAMEGEVI
jgi:hypothetical protein